MKFYHATLNKNLYSIIHNGLKMGIDHCVYLADSKENAYKFVRIRTNEPILILEIDIPTDKSNNIFESFDHSETFFKCKAWKYTNDIPFDWIINAWRYE